MFDAGSVDNVRALRAEVIRERIVICWKGGLRNLLGAKRSGRRVDCAISHGLDQWGIVHWPKVIPKSQAGIVLLAMRGSPEEKELERFAIAIHNDAGDPPHEEIREDRPSPVPPGNGPTASEQVQDIRQTCSECGRQYSVDETLASNPGYWEHPYSYADGSSRFCLGCWLGCGPKAMADMYAEFERQIAEGNLKPSTALWLKSERTQLGLSRRDLANILEVCARTVAHWEAKGLPKHGTGARTVRATLERIREERRSRGELQD
jgi:hypothetical protein